MLFHANQLSRTRWFGLAVPAFLLMGLATNAVAQDGKYYISANAGASFGNSLTVPPGDVVLLIFPPLPGIDLDQGFTGNLALGARFNQVRAELEVGFKNLDFVDAAWLTTSGNDALLSFMGNAYLLSFMGNAYLDINSAFGIEPYVGVGAGLAKVDLGLLSSEEFAWQLISGADFPLSRRASFGVQYRYFVSGTPRNGIEDLKSHVFMAGFKFFFK